MQNKLRWEIGLLAVAAFILAFLFALNGRYKIMLANSAFLDSWTGKVYRANGVQIKPSTTSSKPTSQLTELEKGGLEGNKSWPGTDGEDPIAEILKKMPKDEK